LNSSENIPNDSYIENRKKISELKTYKTKSDFDKLKQFLEMDRKVLRFYATWDDRKSPHGQIRPFIIQYYLADDTVEVREVHKPNDGLDPFPVLIRRQQIPRDFSTVKSAYASIYLELSSNEIKEYLRPQDFEIGRTVNIYGRSFTVYDMDNFTKAFYYKNMNLKDFTPLDDDQVCGTKSEPLSKMVFLLFLFFFCFVFKFCLKFFSFTLYLILYLTNR
jgi:EF-hand domain-containing protein 1